ncbi:MAG TPA: ATP-dependent DNA helicase [Candidatus Saccharimonadales bacterium]|jgi:DNA helicase-2/ATP-dependent DNA helicase PcrA
MAGNRNEAFAKAYAALNDAQKKAVDQIDGPVLVVAGPGTGKTQLLSMRAGNILRKDPTMLPNNILCLTFTDAAAANMRERLINLIGQDAYQVTIFTFNSFGAWIMNTRPEYFFNWREAATADALTQYRIIEGLLEKLPGNHVLATQSFDGKFFALKQLTNFISDCKRANLQPKDVRQVLDANQKIYEKLTPIINKYWPPRTGGKEALAKINACLRAIEKTAPEERQPIADLSDIGTLILQELHAAEAEANELPAAAQSKPFTAWKNNWLEFDEHKQLIFSASKHLEKLYAAAELYENYQQKLEEQGLVDFNDQIMTVLATLEKHDELRWNLQERFQYVMIDEYQDTNRAQLQLARYVTDAPVHEDRPNILVVGDDDQAIYRFQGADMGNIKEFNEAYRDPAVIALKENYRSNQNVVASARAVSTQIEFSLEKQRGISKKLNINVVQTGVGTLAHEFVHESEHYAWLAAEIKKCMGEQDGSVAVLARERSQLDALVPYLRQQNVAMNYERRENVLDQEHVVALLILARLVHALQQQRFADADALLPEVLSHPMWRIEPAEIWQIARRAYAEKSFWLDVIFEQNDMPLKRVADFLVGLSQQAAHLPLEQLLDALIGITGPAGADNDQEEYEDRNYADARPVQLSTGFGSPFKSYYFGDELFDRQPAEYLTLLSHLSCLRRHLRTYSQGSSELLHLKDLVDFVDAYQRAGLVMLDTAPHREDGHTVQLMTAHRAKGLEFDTVFVIGMNDQVWGRNKSGNSRFSYPRNLNEIKPSDNVADDGLRLLFVAMTRARQNLHLCYFKLSEGGREVQPYAPLLALGIAPDTPKVTPDTSALVAQYEQRWLRLHLSLDHASKHALLHERLATYALSATHFNNFIDVSRGGPLSYLTQNLLHFPSSMSASAAYGIVVHESLRQAHEQVAAGTPPDIDKLLQFFATNLRRQSLSEHDLAYYLQRGDTALRKYLAAELSLFLPAQRVEVDFKNQGVVLNNARLSGKLDRMDFDNERRTIIVSDYKTGSAYGKWDVAQSSQEYERIKLHLYRRQLLFYKLLVDGSSDWGKRGWQAERGILRFVEPDHYGKIRVLPLDYEPAEIEQISRLIAAVWRKIMALDFPDTSNYEPTLAGIQKFERDLLEGNV